MRSAVSASASDGTSSMYDRADAIASTLRESTSTPITSQPSRANATASGRPT
jgi:hypothetical protein